MLNSDKYYSRNGLKAAIEKYLELPNQKSVIFHQDNTKPHVYLQTQQKIGTPWLQCPTMPTLLTLLHTFELLFISIPTKFS